MPALLQIVVGGNAGSTGRISEEIGITAMKSGWESYIAYSRFTRPSESNLIRIGSQLDIILHGMKSMLFDMQGFGSKAPTKKLIKKIELINPDIIHLHHLHGYYINIEILFTYLSKASIPVIWTFHDCWSITGHCTNFDHVNCEKWKTECNNCPQKHEYPKSMFFDRSKKNFNIKKHLFTSVKNMTVVNVSKWLNIVVGSSFMSDIPRQVIYNGIDINKFIPRKNLEEVKAKYGLKNQFVILGVAGVWPERKGLNYFVELSRKIDSTCKIILIGLKKKQIAKLPSDIIGLERTENYNQLVELYSLADVYFNSSVEETFGLTTAEALACGTPAIVFNNTACPEIVDEYTGFVVEKGDYSAILDAIETIKRNGKEFYSRACRGRILNHFNKENKHKEYLDLYESLLKN